MASHDEEVEAELTDALTCISTGEKDVNDADEDGSTTLHLAAERACVPMRSAIVDVEALSGGWAAALSDAGRLFTIDTLVASTGPWSDANEQPAADGDADDDDEDEGRRWLRASPSGALLLLAHRYEQIWASEPGVDMVTLC
ncbi:hypothetical protein Ctob_012299 [Chrysochromulina tobinii]|uniref:Uncharacterized protein n=1 Tax=Chrysochromulina tobinii TaxID=1460289 RepID=A0A0M0JJR1_9EUKA|nr:hypothetical protein Ctob_012299 [Chrysochromulina tobinii]|eukprot:KOO26730.1 hypothetical protein Ctob_012299 [Chrysochromulina sp. CCMP291]